MSAYRDDLEAARLRGTALERELEQLRARNAELGRRRASIPRGVLDELPARPVATERSGGLGYVVVGAWIAGVVLAGWYAAPWVAVTAGTVFLAIMAMIPFGGTRAKDRG